MPIIQLIRQKLKSYFDTLDNKHYRRNILNAIPFWIGAFITGIVSVVYAQLFIWAENLTEYLFHLASWIFFIVTPLCFVAGWWIVYKYAPYARGSGIPQVTASIELSTPKNYWKVKNLLSLRVILVKVISSFVMILGGGVLGREGPTIQISAAIFKKINNLLPDWYPKISKRNMIVTGAAAGLAAAFNTPLGGIVFAIEELTKTHLNYFKSALLVGVIIAGLTALNILGPYLYLGYPELSGFSFSILLVLLPVALLAGISGSGMGRIILFILSKKSILKNIFRKLIYPITAGLMIAALAYFVDFRAMGSGKEIMLTTLFSDDKNVEWYIPLLRIFGAIVTFSNGAAGGIFAPSLSAGASIGSFVSGWFHLTGAETNLMILCGMVGCLTGITRSPFTSSILVIEMTNSHNIIFHLMLTALLANVIASMISPHSFYHDLKDIYISEINQKEAH